MSGVFYCSKTNSTFFTDCCNVAINDSQRKCPVCREYVYPYAEGMSDDEIEALDDGPYGNSIHVARARLAGGR